MFLWLYKFHVGFDGFWRLVKPGQRCTSPELQHWLPGRRNCRCVPGVQIRAFQTKYFRKETLTQGQAANEKLESYGCGKFDISFQHQYLITQPVPEWNTNTSQFLYPNAISAGRTGGSHYSWDKWTPQMTLEAEATERLSSKNLMTDLYFFC